MARQLFIDLHSRLRALNEDILSLERRISAQVRLSGPMQRVHEIPGVGAITASAVVATVGNATDFEIGRQDHAGPNHQTRRSIPENPARARRTYSAHERHQPARKNQSVGHPTHRTARL